MSGIGQEQQSLVTQQLPLPASVDGVLGAVRSILRKDRVHSIHIELGKPIVYQSAPSLEDVDPGADPDLSDLSPYEVARRVEMFEFDAASQGLASETAVAIVSWMLVYVETKRLVPTHILVGSSSDFWKWAGVPRSKSASTFLGMNVLRDAQMPSQAFLIFGNEDRWALPHEAKLIVKGAC